MNFNQFLSAEREGFEPPEPLSSTVFKASMRHTFVLKAVQSYECFLILQTFLHVF